MSLILPLRFPTRLAPGQGGLQAWTPGRINGGAHVEYRIHAPTLSDPLVSAFLARTAMHPGSGGYAADSVSGQ
jgi:hypothetical protein